MYLSKLYINTGNDPDRPRPGRLWLENVYHIHQRLCMAFPSAVRKDHDPHFVRPFASTDFGVGHVHVERSPDRGFLFRVEPSRHGQAIVIVQSALLPDWDYAFHNAGFLLSKAPEVHQHNPRFNEGQLLRFKLAVNPTRKIDTKSDAAGVRRNGKRVPVQDAHLVEWLKRKGEAAGFAIQMEGLNFETSTLHFSKQNNGVLQSLRVVTFSGAMRVTNPGLLGAAIAGGVGTGKAFGFGLLSVASVE